MPACCTKKIPSSSDKKSLHVLLLLNHFMKEIQIHGNATVRNTTMRTENRTLYICIAVHLVIQPSWRGHLLCQSFGVCAKRNTANTVTALNIAEDIRLHCGDWHSGTSLQSKRNNPMVLDLKALFPSPIFLLLHCMGLLLPCSHFNYKALA